MKKYIKKVEDGLMPILKNICQKSDMLDESTIKNFWQKDGDMNVRRLASSLFSKMLMENIHVTDDLDKIADYSIKFAKNEMTEFFLIWEEFGHGILNLFIVLLHESNIYDVIERARKLEKSNGTKDDLDHFFFVISGLTNSKTYMSYTTKYDYSVKK